jgi:hypothetical protein
MSNVQKEKIKLNESQRYFIRIPYCVWADNKLSKNRVGVYSYLCCKASLDSTVLISLQRICEWLDKKVDKHKRSKSMNEILGLIDKYQEMKILELPDRVVLSRLVEARLNKERIEDICHEEVDKAREIKDKGKKEDRPYFATIYIDEIEKIINYKDVYKSEWNMLVDVDKDNGYEVDIAYVLLVFAYFRGKIIGRSRLRGMEDVHRTEAHNAFYRDIAKFLGLSERVVSKAISILVDLNLIYERKRPTSISYEYDCGKKVKKYVSHSSIFCNTYMRIGGYLVDYGADYYNKEADDKEKYINEKGYL